MAIRGSKGSQRKLYSKRFMSLAIAAVVGAAGFGQRSSAGTIYWSGGSTTDGKWSDTGDWTGATAPGSTTVLTSTDIADFNAAIANSWGNAAGNPVVIDSTTQNINGITFDAAAGNYFIGSTGGNSLLLTNGGTIQILSALTATNAVETINAPLVIEGASATYTFANNSANGTGAGVGTLNFGGGITGGAAGTTVLTLSGTNTNANTISGIIANGSATTLGLTKSGAGTWVLSGSNSYTGNTTVSGGTLQINGSYAGNGTGNTSLLTIGGGTLSVGSSAGTLTFGGDGYAYGAAVGDSGSTGTLIINGGVTNIAGAGGTAASLNIGTNTGGGAGNGTVTITGGVLNVGSRILMSANSGSSLGTLTLSGGTLNLGYNGGYSLGGNQPGVFRLGGGTSTVNLNSGGTLKLFSFQSDSATAANTVVNFNGATVQAQASNSYFFTNGAGTGVGIYTTKVQSGGAIIDTQNYAITIGTALVTDGTTPGGGLTKLGTGALTISGTNTYTGNTLISAGTLTLGSNLALQNSALDTTGTGTLAFSSGINTPTFGGLTGANALTLASNVTALTLNLGTGVTQTFSGALGGVASMTLTKTGAGTQILSGSNTYTGGTTVSSGILQFAKTTALPSSGVYATTGTGTLAVNVGGTGEFTNLTSGVGTIGGFFTGASFAAGTTFGIDTTNAGGSLTYAGSLTGSAGLTKLGSGTLVLTGSNTYAGKTFLNAGVLNIAADAGLGTAPSPSAVVDQITFNGGTLQMAGAFTLATTRGITLNASGGTIDTQANNIAYGGLMAGSGAFTKAGTGTLTLSSNASTFTGNVALNSGTVLLSTGGLGTNATTSGLGNPQTAGRTITVGSGSTLSFTAHDVFGNAASAPVVQVIINSGNVQTDGHLITLGPITLNGGTMTAANSSGIGYGFDLNGLVSVTGSGTSTLTSASSASQFYLNDTGAYITQFDIASGATLQVSGVLRNNWGSLASGVNKTNAGPMILTGANTYTGGTTIGGGTLQIAGAAGVLGGGSYAGAISNSGTLQYSSSAAQTLSGNISGSGSLIKDTALSTLTLSGSNTYTGGTSVTAGTLQFAKEVSLYNNTPASWTATNLVVSSGATAAFNVGGAGEFTISDIATLGALGTATGGFTSGSAIGLDTTNAAGGAITYSGVLANTNTGANTLGLTKLGSGTLILTGTNTYTGVTTIRAGTLTLGNGALGNDGVISATGGVVDNATLAYNLFGAQTYTGVISGTGALAKSGAGVITLSASNSFTGGVTINAGTLLLGNAGALNSAAGLQNVVAFGAGSTGTLSLNGNSVVVANLTTSATPGTPLVQNANSTPVTLTIGNSTNAGGTFAGVIQDGSGGGTLTLTKAGTGVLTLSGANTYTGVTTLTAGTLNVGGTETAGTAGPLGKSVANNPASILFNGGTLQFSSLNTSDYSGRFSAAGSQAWNIDTNNQNVTFASALIGPSSALTKLGAGTLTLSGSNTYTGNTTVSAGILNIAAGGGGGRHQPGQSDQRRYADPGGRHADRRQQRRVCRGLQHNRHRHGDRQQRRRGQYRQRQRRKSGPRVYRRQD